MYPASFLSHTLISLGISYQPNTIRSEMVKEAGGVSMQKSVS